MSQPQSQQPPQPQNPYQKQLENLNVLSIFHFVGAGLGLLGIGGIFLHFVVFRALMMNPQGRGMPGMNSEAMKMMLLVMYTLLGSFYLISLVVNLMAGIFLRSRTNRVFCLLIAGFNCLHVPLGTALGIFTLVVLMNDRTKELFAAPVEQPQYDQHPPQPQQPLHPPSG